MKSLTKPSLRLHPRLTRPLSSSTAPNTPRHLLDLDRRHVLHPYASMTHPLPPFPVSSAQGVHLTLSDGRRIIDGMSSWWAALHGYRHPALDEALARQVRESMAHVMFGGLTHRPGVELVGRLLRAVNGPRYKDDDDEDDDDAWLERTANQFETRPDPHFSKVFLSDSGSIAIEVAMKMAVQYWFATARGNASRKTRFVAMRGGYHGDTFGAMSISDPENGMHSMWGGMLAKQFFVPSPAEEGETMRELEEVLGRHAGEVAAVVMEPVVQGAGGMRFYPPAVLRRVRELCDEYDVLLIFDEIATGFGRTGALFAGWHDEESYRPWFSTLQGCRSEEHVPRERGRAKAKKEESIVYPDIVCLGKALTGGYVTMGATVTTSKVAHGISDRGGPFMHGPTFMANPLACSVALASLKLIRTSPWEDRVNHVREQLIKHLSPLAQLSSVREVRVLGAIGVCELKESLTRDQMEMVQQTLVNEGVWLRPFGKLLYTMPPFNCEELNDEHLRKIGRAMHIAASGL